MSQYDFGNLSSPLPGSTLVDTHLEPWRNALHSLHSGSARPSYAVAGMMWLDTTTDPWILNVFDGTDDIVVGTFDVTGNIFTPAGGILNNLTATTAPTVNDDSGDGYAVGSLWINTTTDLYYLCVDASLGAAVWHRGLVSPVAVADGGTGATTLTANNVLLGNGTSAVQFVAPGTSGNVLTSNGTTWQSTALSTSGTFTPTVFGTSTAGTATYSVQSGNYQRIANVVFYSLTIVWSGHTGTGNMRFGGLPFTSAAGSGPMAPVYYDGIAVGAGKSGIAQVIAGTDTMAMYALDPAGAAAQVAVDAGGEINIAGFYFV